MSLHTSIEWCDSTQNPAMGCDGCELWNEATGIKRCYAGKLTERYGGHSKGYPAKFTEPQLFPERIAKMLKWSDLTGTERKEKPWLNGYPRLIFLGDMGDNFTESLPLGWMAPYILAMAASPHIQIILTKRPGRMLQFWREWCDTFGPIPQNFWLLTSVTGPENVGRIRELLKLRALGASVLGVSYEPAWGAVGFGPWLVRTCSRCGGTHRGKPYENPCSWCEERGHTAATRPGLDWIISGAESGAGAQPSHPDWFRSSRDVCQAAGVAYFHKQNGEYEVVHQFNTWPKYRDGIAAMHRCCDVVIGADGLECKHGGPEGKVYPIVLMRRVGKKTAGALLDGREWRQMPPVARTERTPETTALSESLTTKGQDGPTTNSTPYMLRTLGVVD